MLTEEQPLTAAEKYLQSRGINLDVAARLGVKASEKYGERVVQFDFVKASSGHREVVNRKYRALDLDDDGNRRIWQDKNGWRIAWNECALLDFLGDLDEVVITEGEFDTVIAVQAGYPHAVSVPNGARGAPTPMDEREGSDFDWLLPILPALKRAKRIILATDGDGPGFALMHDIARRLKMPARTFFLEYPLHNGKRLKDLNEVWLAYGEKGVKATIARAKRFEDSEDPDKGSCRRLSDFAPEPERPAYKSGMGNMDFMYRVVPGTMCVITGIPSHGKTTWLNDFLSRLAMCNTGLKVAWGSFEQSPRISHQRKLRRWFLGEDPRECSLDDIEQADAWIDETFRFLRPIKGQAPTIKWLVNSIEKAVLEEGCKVVVVDPWNELVHPRGGRLSNTDYINDTLLMLQDMAENLDFHLIIVAHTKKMEIIGGKYRRPTLYDIADSAAWYNKPDIGIIIYRNKDEGVTEVHVEKVRDEEVIGEPGVAHMVFDRQTLHYSSYTGPKYWEN